MFSYSKDFSDPSIVEQVIKENSQDLKLIKKLMKKNKGTYYPMYVPYVLRPHVGVYERRVIIDNSTFAGNAGLRSGNYTFLAIEGIHSLGSAKKMFNEKFNGRRKFNEGELFYSTDYCSSVFHKQELFMSSWGLPWDSLQIIIGNDLSNISGIDLTADILRTLKEGYLALMFNLNINNMGYNGLCLVFLDKLCLGHSVGN